MALIGNDPASYNGTPISKALPDAAISGTELEHVASDVAYTYQQIKGTDLSGAALSNISKQAHDGVSGHLLALPLAQYERLSATYRGVEYSQAQSGLSVGSDSAKAVSSKRTVSLAAFLPQGQTTFDVEIEGRISAGSAWGVSVSILDDSFATIASTHTQEQDGDLYTHHFYLDSTSSTGQVIFVFISAVGLNTALGGRIDIDRVRVLPTPWRQVATQEQDAPAITGAIPAPIVDSAWHNIYDFLTSPNRPLSSLLLGYLGSNLNRVTSLVTGSPALGASTASPTGHTHDGSNSAQIDFAVAGIALGFATTRTGTDSADGWQARSPRGTGFAPVMTDGSLVTTDHCVSVDALYLPPDATSRTMHWGCLVYDEDADGVSITVKVDADIYPVSYTHASAAVTTAAASSGAWYWFAGTVGFDSDTAQWAHVFWESRLLKSADPQTALVAVAYWLEA